MIFYNNRGVSYKKKFCQSVQMLFLFVRVIHILQSSLVSQSFLLISANFKLLQPTTFCLATNDNKNDNICDFFFNGHIVFKEGFLHSQRMPQTFRIVNSTSQLNCSILWS